MRKSPCGARCRHLADGNPAGLFPFSRPWRGPSPDGRGTGRQSGKRPADDRAEDGRQVPRCRRKKAPQSGGLRRLYGADDGNRTRVFGLGSGHSAIELHLRHFYRLYIIIQKNGSVKSNCAICAVPGQFFLQSHCKVTGMAGPAAPPERRRNSPAHRLRRCCVVFPGRPPAASAHLFFRCRCFRTFPCKSFGRSGQTSADSRPFARLFSGCLLAVRPTVYPTVRRPSTGCSLAVRPFSLGGILRFVSGKNKKIAKRACNLPRDVI